MSERMSTDLRIHYHWFMDLGLT